MVKVGWFALILILSLVDTDCGFGGRLLKRGVMGTYHNVSKKYLPLYLAEFQFRFNNRNEKDIFHKAIAGC